MPYQLTNKKDKALSIAPALDMLEKFVMQKKREEDIKKVTSIVSGNFNSAKSVDELLGKQSEVIHNIISNPDIDPEVKSYGMQLINTYTNVLSNKLKQEEIKKEKSLTLEGLKDNYFLLNDKVYKGEELIADYKSKGLTEDQIYDAVSKIKRLAVNYELKQLTPEQISKFKDNTIKYRISKVLKDDTRREVGEIPDDENVYIRVKPKGNSFTTSAVKFVDNKPVEVEYNAEVLHNVKVMADQEKRIEEERKERRERERLSTPKVVIPLKDLKVGDITIPAGQEVTLYLENTPAGYKFKYQTVKRKSVNLEEVTVDGRPATINDFEFSSKGETTQNEEKLPKVFNNEELLGIIKSSITKEIDSYNEEGITKIYNKNNETLSLTNLKNIIEKSSNINSIADLRNIIIIIETKTGKKIPLSDIISKNIERFKESYLESSENDNTMKLYEKLFQFK